MRLIKSNAEVWTQQIPPKVNTQEAFVNLYLKGMYEFIERCGRTCYKSEDKLGEKPAEDFVKRMINSKHYAMLEHGTVYLTIPCSEWDNYVEFTWGYGSNPYVEYDDSECDWEKGKGNIYITTNYRVIVENHWEDDLKYLSVPLPKHEKRITFCFTTDRGVTHELVRHRVFSFAQESTRYCNYGKDKFGKEITFIEPSWYEGVDSFTKNEFDRFLRDTESLYLWMLDKGLTPQQARQVLPNATKATIIMTGFRSDWEHVWDLRLRGTTGAPHPDMKQLMEIAYAKYEK